MQDFPFVTVIMPIHNEVQYIARSLRAVMDQDYPLDRMEIMIVDGLSTDGTREVVESMCGWQPTVWLIDNPNQIVAKAINAVIHGARGEIIIRVDGHCEIAPDYVRRCVEHLLNDGVDAVGGSLHTIGETPLSAAMAVGMSSTFGVGGSAFRTALDKTMLTDTVPFPAYTRTIIRRAGDYDEELVRNQDDEYNYRLRALGAKILLADDVRSKYYARRSLPQLWRQYFQYGYWKVRVMQKHPRQMSLRQFVPPLFVAVLLSSLLIALSDRAGWLLLAAELIAYLGANLLASIWVSAKRGWRYLPLLPVIFGILHVSYGLGFLIGLIKFIGRWHDRVGQVPRSRHRNESYDIEL